MKVWQRVLVTVGVLAVGAGGFVLYEIGGPRNLIGMLRYDQRAEGALKVGDVAPDVVLTALDGTTQVPLLGGSDVRQPTVVIFGSFT